METISRPICGSAQSMGPAQDQLRCEPGTMLGLVIHCNPRSWVIFLTRTFGLRLRCEMGMEGAGCWLGWRYPRMQMGEAVLGRKKTSDTRNLFIALRITDQVQVVGASGLGISASSLICERLPSLSFWKKLCGYGFMDEVQKAFYRLEFRVAFSEKKGTEFQDWFVKLASYAFGSDFEAIRSDGREGDHKCDGRLVSTDTIFQCYAPDQLRTAQLNKKIREDFLGAVAHWDDMREWVLVHNHSRGLSALSAKLLDELRKQYPTITIEVWAKTQLEKLVDPLDLSALQSIFGYAPNKMGMETLIMEDLKPVIDRLQKIDPSPSQVSLIPPSVKKLEKNALSADVEGLLKLGRRKEALVETYFRKNPRPDLGERIAEEFRRRYGQLKENGKSPDEIFAHLQQYAGSGVNPKQQGAALAVLSYFFERCDIFEDPVDVTDAQ